MNIMLVGLAVSWITLLKVVTSKRADESLYSRFIPEPQQTDDNETLTATASAMTVETTIRQYNYGDEDYVGLCPSLVECAKLGGECVHCNFNKSCVYGANVTVQCSSKKGVHCTGPHTFGRLMICQYCYQSDSWDHVCSKSSSCTVSSNPRERYLSNCTVKSEVLCLGNRTFQKYFLCNWTGGYRWTTALILSITLGGFGADRFYLGHWQEGIGKLFSFGGLGVWTLLDVILIAIGYLGPADGSLYIW